jgi:hypothetical protein
MVITKSSSSDAKDLQNTSSIVNPTLSTSFLSSSQIFNNPETIQKLPLSSSSAARYIDNDAMNNNNNNNNNNNSIYSDQDSSHSRSASNIHYDTLY